MFTIPTYFKYFQIDVVACIRLATFYCLTLAERISLNDEYSMNTWVKVFKNEPSKI